MKDDHFTLKSTGGWPQPRYPLVGRSAELAALLAAVDSGSRLITITGAGGIGKTRLVLSGMPFWKATLGNHVAFAQLARCTTRDSLTDAIATAASLLKQQGNPVGENRRQELSSTRLLVLDSFEHHIADSVLMAELIELNPALQLIVTSRLPLRTDDEFRIEVPPLPVPDLDDVADPDALAQNESVTLFVARARESDRDFTLDADNAMAVASLCVKLAGSPLAIEIAAARCRHLSPQELLMKLESSSSVLSDPSSKRPERHHSVSTAIAWSFSLLQSSEQRFLERLSLFSSSFDQLGAEAIAAAQPPIAAPVLDMLSGLIDHGLLTKSSHPGGTTRYAMLSAVQQFARERLQSNDQSANIRMALARYFLDRATSTSGMVFGPQASASFLWFELEQDHLRAALDTFVSSGRAYPARCLVLALWPYWWLRGFGAEGASCIESAFRVARDLTQDGLDMELCFAAALLGLSQNDLQAARRHVSIGLTAARQAGDPFWNGALLMVSGLIAVRDNEYHHAISLFEILLKSVDPGRGSHPLASQLAAMTQLASSTAQAYAGDLDEAEYRAGLALNLYLRQGSKHGVGLAKLNLAQIALKRGQRESALDRFHDSVPLLNEMGDSAGAAEGLLGLANLATSTRLARLGATLFGMADRLGPDLHRPFHQIIALDRGELRSRLEAVGGAEKVERIIEAARNTQRKDLSSTVDEAISTITERLHPSSHSTATFGIDSLSEREREVLCLISDDLTDREIGDALFIAYRTVTSHTTNILHKLDVKSRAGAVAIAIRQGVC